MPAASIIACAVCRFALGFGDGLERFEFRQAHMGSTIEIVLYTTDASIARRASDAAFARIHQLDLALSDYNPESELSRLCEKAGGPPVAVSKDLFDVLKQSLAMADRSGGAFDPTIGPVVRLWRRARRDNKLPDPTVLDRARKRVDYRNVVLDESARAVALKAPGIKLDLGGIAKGYAAQAARDELARLGVSRALVAVAGDIVVGDAPPGKPGWRIAIARVANPNSPPKRFLILNNAAVSTSGDAERFVEIGGKRYSHIVDPRTGLGVVDRCGVTIVAKTGAIADSLATAVYVLGPEAGRKLVDQIDGAAGLIARSTPNGEQVFESLEWKNVKSVNE